MSRVLLERVSLTLIRFLDGVRKISIFSISTQHQGGLDRLRVDGPVNAVAVVPGR